MLSALGREQIIQIVVLLFCRDGYHALMIAGLGQACELVTRDRPYRNAGCPAKLQDLLASYVVPAPGNPHIFKSASPGRQRLLDRMDTEDNLHPSQSTSARNRVPSEANAGLSHRIRENYMENGIDMEPQAPCEEKPWLLSNSSRQSSTLDPFKYPKKCFISRRQPTLRK